MNFLKWYRNIIESSDLAPPDNTWSNIQDQLDIDNSWQVIDNYLNRREKIFTKLRISAAASLLILTVAGAGLVYFTAIKPNRLPLTSEIIPSENIDRNYPESSDPDNIIIQRDEGELDAIYADIIPEADSPEEIKHYEAINDYGEEPEKGKLLIDTGLKEYRAGRDNPGIMNLRDNKPDITDMLPVDHINLIADAGHINQGDNVKGRKAFSKFYFGTRGQLANTWLVNQKTISGFKSSSLVKTNATFGSNFGFFAGTNLFNRLDLQMDFNILAQNNQDYNEYLNGHYVTNKLKLDYSQLALSFRYYLISNKFMEGEHGINFGGYLAYLHNAYQKIDGETLYLSDNYNSMDYGLLLGYEYIFPIYGKLGLGTGFRAYYGLNNIYAGDENIPYYLNITNNASVNITLSIKYVIK